MFLTRVKPIYRISHLYFENENEKILQQYKETSTGPFNLPLKFIKSKEKSTLWNKIFLDRELKKKFDYTINFIDRCVENTTQKNREEFPNIEENLLENIENFMKSRPQQIIVHECDVRRAFYLEEKKIHGVFFHRKLNLAKSCYSTEFNEKTKDLKYRMKGKLKRSEEIYEYEKVKKMYDKSRYPLIYKDTYEGFQQSEFITRALIKIVADLKVEIRTPEFEESIRLGYQGPTEHILQFESYKVPYQEEEWAITDIDFFLEGNYHFPKDKY